MIDCMVYSFKTDLLQVLDLGVEEGRLVVAVAGLAQQMEEDRTFAQEELARLKVTNENTASSHVTSVLISDWLQGENDWLREELEEAERRLEEVLATVAGLEVEQQQRVFLQEVSCSLSWAVTLYTSIQTLQCTAARLCSMELQRPMQMLALASAVTLARCWANILLKVSQILF